MNNLIDRMITRVQRPISPVEPLLAQLYVPRPNVLVDSEVNLTPAIESRVEAHTNPVSNQSNVGLPRAQLAQDAPDPPPFLQSTEQRPQRGNFSTPEISVASRPTPPLLKMEPFFSAPTQLYEKDSPHTQSHRQTQSTTQHMGAIHDESYSKLATTRLATPVSQNESTKKTERSVDQGNNQIQLQPASTTEVNISIGHIEVRAIQRTEPVRRSVAPSHVTLDDYLRRQPGASR